MNIINELQIIPAGSIPAASTILTSYKFQKHLIGLEIKAFFIYFAFNKV